MSFRQIVGLAVLMTALLAAGCSESPELAAAKKISRDLAKARDLMEQQGPDSYAQAEQILQGALRTPNATAIAKQGAHELLATLLSEINAREFTDEEFSGLGQDFAQADSELHYALSEISAEAAGLAYVAGLAMGDGQTLQQYRQKLTGMVPQAITDKDKAENIRMELEKKLIGIQQQVHSLRVEAQKLFLKAEGLSGDEYVSAVAQAAGEQLKADRLAIEGRNAELVLQTARQDELARQAELAKLQETLASIEQQINDHAGSVSDVMRAGIAAKVKLQSSADGLVAKLKSFDELGTDLDAAYQVLIERQGQAVTHYDQALSGAAARSRNFREFKSAQPAGSPTDERVEMLTPVDAQVDLAVSRTRAEILRVSAREDYADLLARIAWRTQQVQEVAKALSVIGVQTNTSQIATSVTEQRIQQVYISAKDDLSLAIRTLRTTAMPRQKDDDSAEQIVEGLAREVGWNWQVWAMLGLAHQARAELCLRMGEDQEAQADSKAASVYLSNAGRIRPSLVGLAGSN